MAPDLAMTPPARLPNLVIAGVSKAETTSLFHYLSQHPEVGTSDVKEVRYFTPLRYGKPLDPIAAYSVHSRNCALSMPLETEQMCRRFQPSAQEGWLG